MLFKNLSFHIYRYSNTATRKIYSDQIDITGSRLTHFIQNFGFWERFFSKAAYETTFNCVSLNAVGLVTNCDSDRRRSPSLTNRDSP